MYHQKAFKPEILSDLAVQERVIVLDSLLQDSPWLHGASRITSQYRTTATSISIRISFPGKRKEIKKRENKKKQKRKKDIGRGIES